MKKITLLRCLFLYGISVLCLGTLFGSASLVEALGGSSPQSGTLSDMLSTVAGWFSGHLGKGLATLLFFILTLLVMGMILFRGVKLAFSAGSYAAASSPSTWTGVDDVLSFLEPLLPARTMIEVGGDVRERITRLHDQGASPWKIRRRFATGLLLILLDAMREALATRKKTKG